MKSRKRDWALGLWVIECAAFTASLLLAPQALAAPPTHIRTASLDVSGLNHACGVATDTEGDLYASSAEDEAIKVYDPSHTEIASIANANEPCALALSTEGQLLVSERGTGNVVMYVPDEYPLSGSPSYGPPFTIDGSGQARGISIDPSDDRLYVAEGESVSIYTSEVQRVQVSNAKGGSFKLAFEGEETAPLPYNASTEEVQGALEGLAGIGAGNVALSGSKYTISFAGGELAYAGVPQIEALGSLEGNETQRVTVKAEGGTFTLTFEGQETAAIPYNATATELEEALEELSNLEAGDVSVTGGPGDATGSSPYEVTFEGDRAAENVGTMSADGAGLTGATTSVKVTTPKQGAGIAASTTAEGGLFTINEVQAVRVNEATGGTFTLEFEGEETAPIPYDAGDEAFREKLEELAALAGNIEVKKPATAYNVTFIGALAGQDVPAFLPDNSGLEGAGEQNVSVVETTKGQDGIILEGELSEATGLAAYTYTDATFASRLYLSVADAEGDELKLFSGPTPASEMRLRRTITGVDHDEDPGTPEQEFEFGPQGAYLAADPGNESPAHGCEQVQFSEQDQACTAGHLFLYDAGHEAIDEFEAGGRFLDQFTAAGIEDGEPTQIAVQRSGEEGDGTVYASSGSSTGARLAAFGPLWMPSRELDASRSHVLEGAKGVATDFYGNLYVYAKTRIYVYDPAGAPITDFEVPDTGGDLAVDSQCNVYMVETTAPAFAYYSASQCPPTSETTFTRHTLLTDEGMSAVAVNPADDHVFLAGSSVFPQNVLEFESAAEGSGVVGECAGAGLSPFAGRFDIDVDAASGEVYVTANGEHLSTIVCGPEPEPELVREIQGGGCPGGHFGSNPAIAIDQASGHLLEFATTSGETVAAREHEPTGACVSEFGTFFSTVSGYRVAVDNSCSLQEPPLHGEACEEEFPANGTAYVAFDSPNAEQPYDVTAFGGVGYVEPPPPTTWPLSVNVTGEGAVECKVEGGPEEPCAAEYEDGAELTLAPSPETGWEFEGFSGGTGSAAGCTGTAPCAFTIEAASEVDATFVEESVTPKLPLTVSVEEGTGTGTVTSDPGLISCDPFCEDEFAENEEVTLTASPAAGSLFMAWKHCDKGGVYGRQCTVTMSEAKEVSAVFIVAHDLTLAKAEGSGPGKVQTKPGGVNCPYSCTTSTAAFKEGTAVLLKTIPAKHFHLAGFSGDCEGTGPCELSMGEDHQVKALFEEDPKLSLDLSKGGGGQALIKTKPAGVVCGYTCTDASASFYEGEALEVRWKLKKGTTKLTWAEGAGTCTGATEEAEGTCTVTMSEALGLVAVLE